MPTGDRGRARPADSHARPSGGGRGRAERTRASDVPPKRLTLRGDPVPASGGRGRGRASTPGYARRRGPFRDVTESRPRRPDSPEQKGAAPAAVMLPLGVVLRRYGVRPGRRLGQHFLLDPRILRRIAAAAEIQIGDPVLEVGPGVGSLTRELMADGARVLAVEMDRRFAAPLAEVAASAAGVPLEHALGGDGMLTALRAGLNVVWGDAVRLDWRAIADLAAGPWKVCSNLPYHITGPFLAALFGGPLPWSVVVLTVQLEAAERMLAPPGSGVYGAFSCLVQYHAQGEMLFPVPRGAFVPPPAVDSCVVRLVARPSPPTPAARGPLLRVVRAAFGQRRKTLRNALAGGLQLEVGRVQAVLAAVGEDGTRRAETLSLMEFGRLALAFQDAGLLTVVGERSGG